MTVVPPAPCLPWWDTRWRSRIRLSIDAGAVSSLSNGNWVSYTFNHAALVAAGAAKDDGRDLRIGYWNGVAYPPDPQGDGLVYRLDEATLWNTTNTTIWFLLNAPIAAGTTDFRHAIYFRNDLASARVGLGTEPVVLRKMQTGPARINMGSPMTQVTISGVRMDRAFLVFQTRHAGTRPADVLVRAKIHSTAGNNIGNQLQFIRSTSSPSAPPVDIRWYVADFVSGLRVQQGEVDQALGTVDINQVVPPRTFVLWSKTPQMDDANWGPTDSVIVDIAGQTNLSIRSDGTEPMHTIAWQTVFLVDEGFVQRAPTSALAPGASYTNVTLQDPVNRKTSFAHGTFRTPGGGLDVGSRMLLFALETDTRIGIRRGYGGDDDLSEIAWQVVDFGNPMVSIQEVPVTFGSTGYKAVTPLPVTSVDPTRTIALASGVTGSGQNGGSTPASGGGAPGVCSATFEVMTSQVVADRSLEGATCNLATYVIEFPRIGTARAIGGTETSPGPSCTGT